MKPLKPRHTILISLLLLIFVILFFLSTLAKYYVQQNSMELIGRRVTIDELHFNYLNVSVSIQDFILYEEDAKEPFVSFAQLYINFDPWRLLHDELKFSEIALIEPNIQVIQDISGFNFDDLAASDTTEPQITDQPKDTSTTKFTLENLSINGGNIVYTDKQHDSPIAINEFNLAIPHISWDSQDSDMGLNFRIGQNGTVHIEALANNVKQTFSVDLKTRNIDLSPATNYLKSNLNINSFNGQLSTDLQLAGTLKNLTDLSVTGMIALDSLTLIDNKNTPLFELNSITTRIKEINIHKNIFHIADIQISEPTLTAILNKNSTNFEYVLQPLIVQDTTETADSLASDTTQQEPLKYQIDSFSIQNGAIKFADNTLNRPFSYALNNLSVTLSGIHPQASDIPVAFSLIPGSEGNISGEAHVDMTNTQNLSMQMQIQELRLLSFSPYSEYFIASPITKGELNYELELTMTPKSLQNNNSIRIEQLDFGKRTKDSTAIKAPVKLALYIIKDPQEVIAFNLPVEGDPSNPAFSYSKILWQAFANFFIKTAAAPFNALASLAGTNPKDLEVIEFDYAQDSLQEKQIKALSDIAQIMQKKPKLLFRFTQFTDLSELQKKLAVNKAKEAFLNQQSLADSVSVAHLIPTVDVASDTFRTFVRTRVPQVDSIGIEPACIKLFTPTELEEEMKQLIAKRNKQVADFFRNKYPTIADKVEVQLPDLTNTPEELRFPHFKTEVSIQ